MSNSITSQTDMSPLQTAMAASMMGHNQPPTDRYAPYRNRTNDIVEAANTWLKSVTEIADEATAKACDDFLEQIKKELTAIDTDRKAMNHPHDLWIMENNAKFRPLTALLDKSKQLLTPLKTKWLQREKDRLAKERAAKEAAALQAMREAEEAAKRATASVEAAVRADEAQEHMKAALAASAAADKAKAHVKGDYVARSSGLRTYWSAQIIDTKAALLYFSERPELFDVLQRLVNAEAREQKEAFKIPGCKATSEERA